MQEQVDVNNTQECNHCLQNRINNKKKKTENKSHRTRKESPSSPAIDQHQIFMQNRKVNGNLIKVST
jgi:hypothetical protein